MDKTTPYECALPTQTSKLSKETRNANENGGGGGRLWQRDRNVLL